MKNIFERTRQGAMTGGILGAAVGTLMAAGAVITAPLSVPAMCLMAGTTIVINSTTGGAIGTLIGGGVGAAAGTAETIKENK